MSFFKDLGEKINKTTKNAVAKSKDLAEIAKVNTEIAKERAEIEMEYSRIGKNAYQAYVDGVDDANLTESLEKIKDSLSKIEVKKDEVLVLKGITICPQCGAKLDMICSFCGVCGTKIER
jgi:hypothetical protein